MKKYLILVLMIVVPAFLFAALILTRNLGTARGLLWSLAVLPPAALLIGVLIWRHRRARGELPEHIVEHRPGSMHYQSMVHLNIAAEKLAEICNHTLRLTTGRESEPPTRDGEFAASTPFNIRDWGQRVILHAENRGTETVVQIESRPRFKLTPPDRGKNARNVQAGVEYLKRYERALTVGIE